MDIDIDVSPNVDTAKLFNVVSASRIEKGELLKHEVGVYFQNIAKDRETGLAAIPYNYTEEMGFLKIDFLNVRLLESFSSKQEMRKLLKTEPDWGILNSEENVNKLFHLKNHYDVVSQVKPKSIDEIADVLMLIRPHKIKLLDKYLTNKDSARKELYVRKDGDKTSLRRSHALAYALLVVLNMHLLGQQNETA